MTAPHPALLLLATGASATIDGEDAFLRSACEHRMVAATLAAHHSGTIRLSQGAVERLIMRDLAERQHHVRIWGALNRVHLSLDAIGIEVAVLKGVATEARWYDELGERMCTDLDLLLSPDALARGAEVAAWIDPARGFDTAIDWLVRRRLLQHVDLRVSDISVDLHFDPLKVGLPTRQLDEVWSSTERVTYERGTIRVLRPEIELSLLLLHLNKDAFAYLGSFLDVRQIVGRGSIDWKYLRSFVSGEGLDVPVWKSLALVGGVLRMDLDVDAPALHGLRARSWDRLWGGKSVLQGDEGRRRAPALQTFLGLHATGRGADKAREVRRQLVPPRRLVEVAGRPALRRSSYVRYLAVERLRGERPRSLRDVAASSTARSNGAA